MTWTGKKEKPPVSRQFKPVCASPMWAIEPDVNVELYSEEHFGGEDPVLRQALSGER